jgi:hypothetical protein
MPKRQVTATKTVEYPALRPDKQLSLFQRNLREFEEQDGDQRVQQ